MISVLPSLFFPLQYSVKIIATTDDSVTLTDFKVFVDDSQVEEKLEADGVTLTNKFDFETTLKIQVTKTKYEDASPQTVTIADAEPNEVTVNLPIKKVITKLE